MASTERQILTKNEYLTNYRNSALVAHVRRYIKWGFDDDSDLNYKVTVEVGDKMIANLRDYMGHMYDDNNASSMYRKSKQAEHAVEREMVQDVLKTKFGFNEKKANETFSSSEHHTSTGITLIKVIVAETAGRPNHEHSSDFSEKQVEQIKNGLTRDLEHELGDLVTDLSVTVQSRIGTKTIGKMIYHDNEPIENKYRFAIYLISFKWVNTAPSTVKKLNGQNKVGGDRVAYDNQIKQLTQNIMQVSQTFNLTPQQLISMMDQIL